MKKYILTGYYVQKNVLRTDMFTDIESVYSVIDHYSHDALIEKYKGSLHDFNFDVMSRRSHNGAVIITDDNFKWSCFQLTK